MAIKLTAPDGQEMLRLAGRMVCIAGSAPDAPKLPTKLLLLPWGQVRSTNGDFLVDDESAQAVIEAFHMHGIDLVIDYEHQSLGGKYAARSGLAPAAGWVMDLDVRTGQGIWGTVRWTLCAARRILRQEYRFLSPVVIVRKQDRRVLSLDSLALTNRPAIAGMQPVVNCREDGCLPAVSIPPETILSKEVPMHEELQQLRQMLSLDETADAQHVAQQACARFKELTDDLNQQQAQQRVICAMQAGKLTEAQKEWAHAFALRDPANFQEWLKGAPVVVQLEQMVAASRQPLADSPDAQRRSIIAAARSEYKDNTLLQRLTGEKAYIDEALQQAGLDPVA